MKRTRTILGWILTLALVVTTVLSNPGAFGNTVYAKSAKVVVKNQKQLNKALADKKIKKIVVKFKTKKAKIPQKNYKGKTLIIDSKKTNINNGGRFKNVIVKNANSITEKSGGNTIAVKGNLNELVLAKDGASNKVNVSGNLKNIDMRTASALNLTGKTTEPVGVEMNAEGAQLTTAIATALVLSKKADVSMEKGSEGSLIEVKAGAESSQIKNNTSGEFTVKTASGETKVKAGETVGSASVSSNTATPVSSNTATGSGGSSGGSSGGGGGSSSGSSSSGGSGSSSGSGSGSGTNPAVKGKWGTQSVTKRSDGSVESIRTYEYDKSGNEIKGVECRYDEVGNVVARTEIEYTYNSKGDKLTEKGLGYDINSMEDDDHYKYEQTKVYDEKGRTVSTNTVKKYGNIYLGECPDDLDKPLGTNLAKVENGAFSNKYDIAVSSNEGYEQVDRLVYNFKTKNTDFVQKIEFRTAPGENNGSLEYSVEDGSLKEVLGKANIKDKKVECISKNRDTGLSEYRVTLNMDALPFISVTEGFDPYIEIELKNEYSYPIVITGIELYAGENTIYSDTEGEDTYRYVGVTKNTYLYDKSGKNIKADQFKETTDKLLNCVILTEEKSLDEGGETYRKTAMLWFPDEENNLSLRECTSGHTIKYIYDEKGNIIVKTEEKTNDDTGEKEITVTKANYNDDGTLASYIESADGTTGTGDYTIVTYTYDISQNITTVKSVNEKYENNKRIKTSEEIVKIYSDETEEEVYSNSITYDESGEVESQELITREFNSDHEEISVKTMWSDTNITKPDCKYIIEHTKITKFDDAGARAFFTDTEKKTYDYSDDTKDRVEIREEKIEYDITGTGFKLDPLIKSQEKIEKKNDIATYVCKEVRESKYDADNYIASYTATMTEEHYNEDGTPDKSFRDENDNPTNKVVGTYTTEYSYTDAPAA